jgi:hypothetical protein
LIQVIDDFLPQFHFEDVQKLFLSEMMPWFYNANVVTGDNHFMFTHAFMDDGRVINRI